MITPKQRAELRKLANALTPIFQVGKGDISDAMAESVSEALEKRELIKLSVLETAGVSAAEAAREMAQWTGAELVQVIGRKFVLYRRSRNNPKIEI